MQESYVVLAAFAAVAGVFTALMFMVKRQDARYERLFDLLLNSLDVNDKAVGLAEEQVRRPRLPGRSSAEAVVRGRRTKRLPPRGG